MTRRKRRRRRLLLLLGVIGALGVAGVGALQFKKVREAHLVQSKRISGMAASEAGDHKQALRDLGYVINKAPDDGEAALAFATSRRQVETTNRRNLTQAVVVARRAAQAMPGDLRPRELLMSLYSEMGLLTERLQAAQDILALDPDHHNAHLIELDSLRRLGRRDEAYEKALAYYKTVPNDVDAAGVVVDLMVELDKPQNDVLDFVEDLIAQAPENVRALLLKSRLLGLYGKTEDAREAALRAATLKQGDSATLAATVQLLDLFGESDTVESLLKREQSVGADREDAAVVAASRAWKDGRIDDAKRLVQEAMDQATDASDALLGWTALIADQSGLGQSALAQLAQRTSGEARSWSAILESRAAIRKHDWPRAASRARRAIELNQRNVVAVFLLGESERAVGDWRSAVGRWRQLIAIEPSWLTIRMDLVTALLAAGQTRDAFNEAIQALEHWPDRMAVAQAAGRAGTPMIERGEASGAEQAQIISLLKAIEEQSSDPAVGAALLTRALAASGDMAGARASLAKLLDGETLPPKNDLGPLIDSCRRLGVFGVDELVGRVAAQNNDSPGVLLAVAMAEYQNGHKQQASARIGAAIDRAKGQPEKLASLERTRALFLDQIGDPGALEAVKEIAAARRDDPAAQRLLLDSRSAWTDKQAVSAAIVALHSLTGEASTVWRVYQARETLTFDPSDKGAAEVVTLLGDVVRAEPENSAALTYLGEAYAVLKDYNKASQMLGRAVDLQPASASLMARLIELLQASGQRDKAQTRLQAFLNYNHLTRDERRRRARLLLRQGMVAQAEQDLQQLAQSGTIEDSSLAAQAAARAGHIAKAKAQFDQILSRPDRTSEAVIAAADFKARNVSFADGLAALDQLPDEVAEVDRQLIVAGFYRRQGRVAEAEKLYADLASRSDLAEAWSALAQLEMKRGAFDDARQAVQKGLIAHPDHHALLQLQIAMSDQDNTDSSLEALQKIADLLDDTSVAREPLEKYIAARTAIAGHPDDAAYATNQLRAITEAYPSFYPAWRDLVDAYRQNGQLDDAATAAREAAFRMPTLARSAELAARTLAMADRFDEALPLAEDWSDRLNDDPYPAQVFIGALLFRMGRNADALARLEPWRDRIVHEALQAPVIFESFAGLLMTQNRVDDAYNLYEKLIDSDPALAINRLRLVTRLRTQPAVARKWIERCISSLPQSPAATAALGQSWYDLASWTGDAAALDTAVELLDQVVNDPDQQFLAATLLAAAAEQKNDLEQAERYYRLAIKARPDAAIVLNNLSYLLFRTDGSIDEAIELAQRAVALADQNVTPRTLKVNYLDSLGAALAKAGRYGEAAAAYDRAVKLEPENVGVLLGLARSQLGGGNGSQAAETIARLTSLRDRGRITNLDQQRQLTEVIEQLSITSD